MENERRQPPAPLSPTALARIAGLAYLAIIVTGIYAEFFVRTGLAVPGDAAATAANISGAQALFRSAIAGELVMLACDVGLAMALYVIFRPVSHALALLAAFFRLVHGAVVAVNLLNVYVPLTLLGGAEYLAAFTPEQLHALVRLLLDTHAYGYVIGLVFFGFHCLALGYLVFRSGYVPGVLGALLVLAGMGYLVDGFARTLLLDYAAYESILLAAVFVPAFIGELSFCLWLLAKGVDVDRPDWSLLGRRPAAAAHAV